MFFSKFRNFLLIKKKRYQEKMIAFHGLVEKSLFFHKLIACIQLIQF